MRGLLYTNHDYTHSDSGTCDVVGSDVVALVMRIKLTCDVALHTHQWASGRECSEHFDA